MLLRKGSLKKFITNQFNGLLPVGSLAQLLERCTGITEASRVRIPYKPAFFRASFSQPRKVVSITVMIFFYTILHPAVLIYDFHIFITSLSSFHGFKTIQFNDLLPAGLLAQLVERCTGIAEVKGCGISEQIGHFAWGEFVFHA